MAVKSRGIWAWRMKPADIDGYADAIARVSSALPEFLDIEVIH
jgi:hypothetical protein